MDTQVYNAAIRGEIYVLEQNREALVDAATPNKNTVLHLSAQLGKTECVQAILSMHPSLLLRQNSRGESPLHLAARDGHADTVKALVECAEKYFISEELESGVGGVEELLRMRTNKENETGVEELLRMRTNKENETGVEELLRMRTNKENETALHLAVQHRRVKVVEYLRSRDPEFEHPANKDGETPLYLAASRGYEELVDVMLNNCSSPATGGPDGKSALHGAVICNSKGIISKLLKWNGCLVKEADKYGWTALHLAARIGVASMVDQLLLADKSAGYLVDTYDKNTALHIAAAQGHTHVVELFFLRCPDCCEIVNGRGKNILHIAVEHCRKNTFHSILRCCETSSTLLNQKDVDGNTPVHLLGSFAQFAPASAPYFILHGTDAFNNQNLALFDVMTDYKTSTKFGGDILEQLKHDGAKRGWQNVSSKDKMKIIAMKKEHVQRKKNQELEEEKRVAPNIVVATLVATIAFTAAFTVPGGYNGNGMATLARKTAFQAFMISDTIALLLSTLAVVVHFLAPEYKMAKRYTSYTIGGTLIALAIGTMMVAFFTGTYAMLAHSPGLAISVCVFGPSFFLIYVAILKSHLKYKFHDLFH